MKPIICAVTYLYLMILASVATPDQDAQAAIAIAQAFVEIGKGRAQIPDEPPRADPPVVAGDSQEESDTPDRKDAVAQLNVSVPPTETTPIEASVVIGAIGNSEIGSGTCIGGSESHSEILTCAHIHDGYESAKPTVTYKGETYELKLVKRDRARDLALWRCDAAIPRVAVAKSVPTDGSIVLSIGAGQSVVGKRVLTYDTYKTPWIIRTTGTESVNRSGGGLFHDGKLVGVIKGYADDPYNGHYSMYVGTDDVHDFLDDIPVIAPVAINTVPRSGMRIEVAKPMQATATVSGPITVVQHSTPWCGLCRLDERRNGNGNKNILFEYPHTPPPEINVNGRMVTPNPPTYIWVNGLGKKLTHVGSISTDELWEIISRPVNHPPGVVNPEPMGAAGSIHASAQIGQAIAFWRAKIGEKVEGKLSWTRGGMTKLDLQHAKDWSVRDMFGATGRMVVSAKGAIALPIDTLGFNYLIDADGIPTIDADPIRLAILKNLKISQSRQSLPDGGIAMESDPMGLFIIDDVLLAWNVLSLVRGIYALLWPEFDLVMPPSIDASAGLSGEKLTIKFGSGPSVRIVSLFTFTLKVDVVEITTKQVRLLFSGSPFVRERTFAVE